MHPNGQIVQGLGRILAVEVAGGDDLAAVGEHDLEGHILLLGFHSLISSLLSIVLVLQLAGHITRAT